MTTAKEYLESLNFDERKVFCAKLESWLSVYTDEVFTHVLENHLDEIVNDPTSLKMIDTLYEYEQMAVKARADYIRDVIDNPEFWTSGGRTFHNSVFLLDDPKPYRTVLHDLYIRDRRTK